MDFLPAGPKNSGLCREVGVSGGSTVEFVTLELARITFHKYVDFDRPGECSPKLRSDADSDNLCGSHLQSQSELYLTVS